MQEKKAKAAAKVLTDEHFRCVMTIYFLLEQEIYRQVNKL
jgi:hypothetical protein